MRTVIQRVRSASVTIDAAVRSSIGPGLLILLGIGHEDGQGDIDWLVRKVAGLRIFNDEDGVMNRSVFFIFFFIFFIFCLLFLSFFSFFLFFFFFANIFF